ncbi:MAG: hypothetical protein HY903_06710 [Deltaproteobacteria bacterium]|nr:hypothetical protein [Deltaproteobacteria bacterium]
MRRRLRKILKITGITLGVSLALVASLLVAVRLYYSDERLRRLGEAWGTTTIGAEVEIGRLELSLFSGIEVGGFRIGPPPGFGRDVVAFERLALHWSAVDLLRLRVVLPEVALEHVRCNLEENDRGQNLEAVLAALHGRAAPQPEVPPEPAPVEAPQPKKPLTQPSVPVYVEVQRLVLSVDEVTVTRPGQQLQVDRLGMEGRLTAEGQSLSLDVWLGLGDRNPQGRPSHFRLQGGAPFTSVVTEQRLGVTLASSGFADIGVSVSLAAKVELQKERPLPPVTLAFELQNRLDLLRQIFTLSRCDLAFGDATRFSLEANGTELLVHPRVRVDKLSFTSELAELQPFVAAFVPDTTIAGRLRFHAVPFDVVTDPAQMSTMQAKLDLGFDDGTLAFKNNAASGLQATSVLTLDAGSAHLEVKAKLRQAQAGPQRVRGLSTTVDLVAPLAPFLGGPPEGSITVAATVGVGEAVAPAATVSNLRLVFGSEAPVALIKAKAHGVPSTSKARLTIGEVAAPAATLRDLRLDLSTRLFDLAGQTLTAELDSGIAAITVPQGDGALTLGDTRMALSVARAAEEINVRRLDFSTADLIRFHAAGVIDQVSSPAPVFHHFGAEVAPIDIAKLLALLPAARRPPATVTGTVGVALQLDGKVPYRELTLKSKPPVVSRAPGEKNLSALMAAYAGFLQAWQDELSRGMPFTASVAAAVRNLGYVDEHNALSGLDADISLAIQPHAPVVGFSLSLAELTRPAVVRGLHTELDLTLAEGALRLGYRFKSAAVLHPSLTRPLENAAGEVSLSYRMGGDLLLDKMLFEAPDRGGRIDASGVLSRPLQFALTRGWQRSGLPGLDATLRLAMALDAGELKPVIVDGPELGGKMGLKGTLRAEDGIVALEGVLETAHLGYRAGTLSVADMSGALPFDVRLAFDPRPDATVLKRDLGVGGGVLALLTSGEDIRRRAARPTFYDRVRSYRQRSGLAARKVQSGSYEIFDFELEGRLTQGMLLADWISMHVLGGDVAGNMALQLGRDRAVRGDFAFKASNLDASYFKELSLKPGPESELSADVQLGLLLAPKSRDLTLNMNVTKIGTYTLDRFLQILDPAAKDEKMQGTRKNLRYVKIDNVAVWMRYESLNMDLACTTFLRIPGTQIGFPNIDRELLRRYPLTDRLDDILIPINDKYLAPLLGWNRAG